MPLQISGQAQGLLSQSQKSGAAPFNIGWQNELLVSQFLPRWAYLAMQGLLFSVASTGQATPAAGYPLGAAGTPIVALYNPPGSGKNALIIKASLSVRAAGTVAAGTFGFSGGPTAAITAAISAYLNMLSLQQSGAAMKPFAATALTGSSALSAIRPFMSAGAGVTQSQFANICTEDVDGSLIVAPGNVIALSAAVTGTADTVDAGLVWAEVPA